MRARQNLFRNSRATWQQQTPMQTHDGHRDTKAICVFCGSSHGGDPAFAEAARKLGRLIAEKGYRMVFGGGGIGLMGETARAARDAGAPVVGILPSFLRHLEPPMRSAEELVVVPDLYQRKERMIALADAFVILPGGLGTLDEFFDVLTGAQLGQHAKPIVLVSVKDYFAPLQALLDAVLRGGFSHYDFAQRYRVAATPEEAMELLGETFGPC
jgi:uncharacterized protein (TIGR00730 family)